MANEWPTFWCEDTGLVRLSLRVSSGTVCGTDDPETKYRVTCAAHRTLFETFEPVRDDDGYLTHIDPDLYADADWPTVCDACGATLTSYDYHVVQDVLYRCDGRGQWTQRELPVGAMFDSWWQPKGPDGLSVTVVCPPGGLSDHWCIDGWSSKGERPWSREGDPLLANLVVHPSIQTGDWHGLLGNGVPGVLVEC